MQIPEYTEHRTQALHEVRGVEITLREEVRREDRYAKDRIPGNTVGGYPEVRGDNIKKAAKQKLIECAGNWKTVVSLKQME